MDRVSVESYCLGLLGLLLLQGVLHVEGRSMFIPDSQSKILALLLHKSLVPVDKDDLAFNHSDLRLQLRALREDLELERKITANMAEGKSITRKRGEPCFWKYCV
uniref:Urotensin 2B n=1 Tax=Stegastes partitus TaxID=144197 RepID=A0A3B5B6G0_9TELE